MIELAKSKLQMEGMSELSEEEKKSAEKKATKYVDERRSLLTNTFHQDKYPEEFQLEGIDQKIVAEAKMGSIYDIHQLDAEFNLETIEDEFKKDESYLYFNEPTNTGLRKRTKQEIDREKLLQQKNEERN